MDSQLKKDFKITCAENDDNMTDVIKFMVEVYIKTKKAQQDERKK